MISKDDIDAFDEFFEGVEEDVESNCDNRMDQYDAKDWMREAYEAGWMAMKNSLNDKSL